MVDGVGVDNHVDGNDVLFVLFALGSLCHDNNVNLIYEKMTTASSES